MRGLIAGGTRAAAIALVAAACYRYVPHVVSSVQRGDEVRVQLSTAGAEELAREIGPRMASIDGRIVDVAADSSLKLAVSQLKSVRGDPVAWQGDATLVVPRSAITSVERRQLARRRTLVASAGAAAAAVAIGVIAVRGAGNGRGSGGPPPPPPP